MSGARTEPSETAGVAGLVLGRAEAIMEFADRHPKMAFESGIEPIALEMRLALQEGALGRLASTSRTRGLSGPKAGDLGVLDRTSRLQSEAARRLGQYEAALEEASSPSLGRTIETVVSIASGLAVLASAF